MAGSERYNWSDAKQRAKSLNMNISKYIQHLIEKDINGKKYEKKLEYAITLIGFSIVILLLLFR